MASEKSSVRARWVGPFVGLLDRQHLIPGESVAEVPAQEANESDWWEPVAAARTGKGADS